MASSDRVSGGAGRSSRGSKGAFKFEVNRTFLGTGRGVQRFRAHRCTQCVRASGGYWGETGAYNHAALKKEGERQYASQITPYLAAATSGANYPERTTAGRLVTASLPCIPNNRFTSPPMTENQNDPLGQMQAAMKFFAEMQKPAQEAMKLFADAQTKFFAQMPAQEATKAFAEMQKPALEAMKAFAEMQNSAQEAMKAFVEMQNSAQEAMKAFVEMQRPAQEAMNLFAEMQKPARQAMKFLLRCRSLRWRQLNSSPRCRNLRKRNDAPVGLSEWLKAPVLKSAPLRQSGSFPSDPVVCSCRFFRPFELALGYPLKVWAANRASNVALDILEDGEPYIPGERIEFPTGGRGDALGSP